MDWVAALGAWAALALIVLAVVRPALERCLQRLVPLRGQRR